MLVGKVCENLTPFLCLKPVPLNKVCGCCEHCWCCKRMKYISHTSSSQWTHNAITMSLWRENDVMMFWHHNDITIASYVPVGLVKRICRATSSRSTPRFGTPIVKHPSWLKYGRVSAPSYIHLGPVSISNETSFLKILWSLEAARFAFSIVLSLWNLTGTPAVDLMIRRLIGY